jgi:hypothetical protein
MQTPAEFARQTPYSQLATDLSTGHVPNFSYIIPDECADMHGAPPWCVDSDKAGSVSDTFLVANGDRFVGSLVDQITASAVWKSGNDAIVVTTDEGNVANSQIATVVITNHGPRRLSDNHSYNHFNLLASLEQGFGLACLQSACGANPMTPLFQVTGSTTIPALPAPFTPAPNGNDSVSPQGTPVKGAAATLTCAGGWNQVPSPSIGNLDNNLVSVSAASPADAWAVGSLLLSNNAAVLQTMAEHWDGSTWSTVSAPDPNGGGNLLFSIAAVSPTAVFAAGQSGAAFPSQALVESFDGSKWSLENSPADPTETLTTLGMTASGSTLTVVGDRESETVPYTTEVAAGAPSSLALVTSANVGAGENDLFGATTAGDGTTWAAGWFIDPASGNHQTLVEHGVGGVWSVTPTPDVGTGDNGFASVAAVPGGGLWAVGVSSGSGNFSTLVVFHC